jgi:hypothetical protein
LRSLLDFLGSNPKHDWWTGVDLFDELQYPQKIALLWQVASALLQENTPALKLTGVNEAAVAAVYAHIRLLIDNEIEVRPNKPLFRKLVLDCLRDEFAQEGLHLPGPRSADLNKWGGLVDACADRILWDRDYEDGDRFLDTPPEQAALLKELLRIDDDYYTTVPQDPTPHQLKECLRRLMKLCGRDTR